MTTLHLRKERAGGDSYGNQWDRDGAVVEVPRDQALVLLAIPDGDFAVVTAPAAPAPTVPATDDETDGDLDINPDAGVETTEPAPSPKAAVTEPAPKRPRARHAKG